MEGERKIKVKLRLPSPLTKDPIYLWLNDKIEIVVVKLEGKVKVFSSLCPHMGAQLQYCKVKEELSCPWHGLTFDSETCSSPHHRYKKLNRFSGEVIGDELVLYE